MTQRNLRTATVMGGRTVRVGDTVKHFGQRFTGCATARVVGFETIGTWVRVRVEYIDGYREAGYGTTWDWDRTEVAPSVKALR